MTCLTLLIGGQLLTALSESSNVVVWIVTTGTALYDILIEGALAYFSVNHMVFSPNGRIPAIGKNDGRVRDSEAQSRDAICYVNGHTGPIMHFAFSPDGRILASGPADRTIVLWDHNKGAAFGTLAGHTGANRCVAFSPVGQRLATAADDNNIWLWDAELRELLSVSPVESGVRWLMFAANGAYLTTNTGVIWLPAYNTCSFTAHVRTDAGSVITMKDKWVTCNSVNVLWLPHEYRTNQFATHGHTLVLVSIFGQVIFFTFGTGIMQPWGQVTAIPPDGIDIITRD